jgi:ABC-type transporter Mla MlaB component
MGLFDFLKKKTDVADTVDAGPDTRLRQNAFVSGPATRIGAGSDAEREAERERQREIARATAAKIDEIELEMTSDIFEGGWSSPKRAPAVADSGVSSTLLDLNTDILLGPDDLHDAVIVPSSAPALEEAVILYANGQLEAAEAVLRASLADLGRTERQPWWMLFDLYQIQGREDAFESVAIDYASQFETSPPPYKPLSDLGPGPAHQAGAAPGAASGATPTARLSGRLDEQAGTQLARVLAPASTPLARLEFQGITEATPAGCALLLDALQRLRKNGRELVLAGADHLVAVLRPMLAIGAGDASQAPWLLLLELLLLTRREKDFEETAMDYCVTFEVSPPSFEAPAHAAVSLSAGPPFEGDRFLLPAVIEGVSNALLAEITEHAARHPALVFDCSRLARIDYAAATVLAAHLRNLAQDERKVTLRDLNHLAAALLRLLGTGDGVTLYAHKY